MKRFMRGFIACFFLFSSFAVFSDRILITGKPVPLVFHNGYFTFPSLYVPTEGYRFVTISGTDRVCFLQIKPELKQLDVVQMIFEENDKYMRWNCYQYDPRFFEIDF